jgi:outer membrane protein insertion porin family
MPKRRFYIYFICLLFLSINIRSVLTLQISETAPQKTEPPLYIQQITFVGNKALDNKSLTTILNIRPKQLFDSAFIENSLYNVLNEYKKLGYIFAKANWEYTPVGKDKIVLKIEISEGERVVLGKIELIGNTVFPKDQLLSKFDIRKNRYFDESIFNNDVERVLGFYSDNGYPMASVSPVDFGVENNRLNLKIQIDAGSVVKIGKIQIDGLKKTKEKVILRELPIRSGIKFDQRNIDETERLLNNMGYFQTVSSISFLPAENDSVNLNVSVTEGATGKFNGLLGYDPSENSESKLAGVLEATEINLLGTGRQISIIGRFGLTDNYELTYQEPWIFGSPVDFGIHFQAIDRPDALTQQKFSEREASLSGTVRMIEFIEGSLGLTYKKIKSSLVPPSNEVTEVLENENPDSAIEPQSLLNGNKYSILLSIKRDSRDYFSNPTKGRLDRIGYEVSRGDFRILKVWIDLNQYLKIYSQQVLALGIHAGRILGDDIPLTEFLYLGGANTLRGYNEDMFRGEGRLYSNLEYRFIVGRNSQFFLFLDNGWVYNKSVDNVLKIGYGLGMRLESLNGLISMDYGLAKGDSILKGKIHISLGAVF